MLVDSHCHLDRLDLDYFKKDLNACLDFAREQGVLHFLCVCIDLANFPAVLAIAEQFKEVSASVGVHPTEQVAEEATLDELIKLAQHPLVVAIIIAKIHKKNVNNNVFVSIFVPPLR